MNDFLMSFVFAFRGIRKGLRERNMKIHWFVAVLVILVGWFKHLSINEWFVILILIAMVLATELMNSSIEELNNVIKKELKLEYRATTDSRDMAAGSVLIIVVAAVIVGLVIFI